MMVQMISAVGDKKWVGLVGMVPDQALTLF